jgi:hypothetical protein
MLGAEGKFLIVRLRPIFYYFIFILMAFYDFKLAPQQNINISAKYFNLKKSIDLKLSSFLMRLCHSRASDPN